MSHLYSSTIASGVIIDGINISNIPYDTAYNKLTENADKILSEISITFTHGDKSWNYSAKDIGAKLNVKDSIAKASKLARTGSFPERIKAQHDLKHNGYVKSSNLIIDFALTRNLIENIKSNVDIPVIASTIDFDPTNYDYFEDLENSDIDLSHSMFHITEGKSGYIVDTESTINDLLTALRISNNVSIELVIKETSPRYTKQTLESCTTLVCHSSSKITNAMRKNDYRNRNIEKAIGLIKGLVTEPDEIVSLKKLLGELTFENGWWESPGPLISRIDFSNMPPPGIAQVVTTLHNAIFRADLKVLEHNFHQYPAYYNDFGMGMDAYVDDKEHDFVFQNTTEYPVFFDAYLLYHSNGLPLYIDIDVYTMPKEDDMHIRAEYVIDENIPSDTVYKEVKEREFDYLNWQKDEEKGIMTAVYIRPRNTQKVSVYKVWYKNCTEEKPGVFTGGIEVKRELSHTVTYPGVEGVVYTKPIEKEDG
jgi:vancomycin resistance protein YoaR